MASIPMVLLTLLTLAGIFLVTVAGILVLVVATVVIVIRQRRKAVPAVEPAD